MSTFNMRTGTPFSGKDLNRLIQFLQQQSLDYDKSIEYSVILEDEDNIIATGSCHGNVIKCVAVSEAYQGNNLLGSIMTHLISYLFRKGITHYFGFTKPKNKEIFCSMGMYVVAETEDILLMENKKNGLNKFLKQLVLETGQEQKNRTTGSEIAGSGAVVMNCNPFTKGHQYLIKTAAKDCSWLHVFILSEEQKFMTSQERFRLVQQGTRDIPNVILHKTSDYMISPAVFPTYFIKDKEHAFAMNCKLDIKIFCDFIAKTLGITKRYVGTEPECAVTGEYNKCLKQYLPEKGIELIELERLKVNDQTVSASRVRKCFEQDCLEQVEDMIPETTLAFLRRKRHECK